MDQNDKIPNDKITKLENEIKVLKNEVQAVLLDLRESYLNLENPFSSTANPATVQPIVINERAPAREQKPEGLPGENKKAEPAKPDKSRGIESKQPEPFESEKYPFAKQPKGEFSDSEDKSKAPNRLVNEPEPEINGKEIRRGSNTPAQSDARPVKPAEANLRKNIKLDLVTIAGLTGWVEQSTQKIGRERTEAVLEISEVMGYVTPDLRPILTKLITLAQQGCVESSVRTRDYVNSLIKLNSLLGNDCREETALLLLSLVSGDTQHG